MNQPRKVNVINHGDMWVNNFMYKYENGVPVDIICVDFQMSSYNSPGVDVNYFMCTSPQYEVREEKREELLDLYCSTFLNTLNDLESINDITADMLKEDIRNFEFNGKLNVFNYYFSNTYLHVQHTFYTHKS